MGVPAEENEVTKTPANGDTAGDAPATPETDTPADGEQKSDVTENDRQIEEGDEETAAED